MALRIALWGGGESELEFRGWEGARNSRTPRGIREKRSVHTEGLLCQLFNYLLSSHRLLSFL